MSFRFGAVGALLLTFALGACASAGNGDPDDSGTTVAPQEEMSEEDLPQWIQDLPEGTPPDDNDHTGEATLFLVQAMQADEDRAQELYRQALEAAEAGIEADPENAQSYYQAGEAHLGLGNLEEAARMFDRAEEIYPRYVIETEAVREEAWIEEFNRAVEISEEEGDREASAEYFERAHTIFQGRPEAMLNLAEIYSAQERYQEAADLYGQAIDIMTGPRAEGMDEEYLETWDEFLGIAYFNRAQLLFRLEDYDEAAEMFEAVLDRDPENLEAVANLAASLVAAGREDEAEDLYNELLDNPDLEPSDYFMIAVGLYQSEAWPEAARAFRESWERVPQNRDAAFNLAQSLYLAEEWQDLVDITDEVLELDRFNETVYRFRAQALVQLENQEAAVQTLEEMEALPFYVSALELHPQEGGASVVGQVTTRQGEPGTSVDLRFYFYDAEGTEVGTADTSVELPQPDEAVQFQADLQSDQPIFAFRYEVL